MIMIEQLGAKLCSCPRAAYTRAAKLCGQTECSDVNQFTRAPPAAAASRRAELDRHDASGARAAGEQDG
jgi:hypothetical protein